MTDDSRPDAMLRSCTIVGPGRAGQSFEAALGTVGWSVTAVLGRTDDVSDAAAGVALVLLTVPDNAIADVAGQIRPGPAVVAHTSGASDLTVLGDHKRVASIHPLCSLPDPSTGGKRLVSECTFAVDGDPIVAGLVADLGGTAISVPAAARSLYHAVACVAANHLTALANQVETLANQVGVPVEAYWELMETTLQNVRSHGSAQALTGPASRGDWDTVQRHLAALVEPDDQALYTVLSQRAAAMAGRAWPELPANPQPTDASIREQP